MIKKVMELLGKAAGAVRPPLVDVKPEEVAGIQKLVDLYQPWV